MTTIELYTKGAKIWVPHPENVWEGAEICENYDPKTKNLIIITESKERRTLSIKSDSDLPHLKNPSILIGENDLTSLSYLHEPAVLHNLQVRFCDQKAIYTYCGIVLVAINPYTELPIYGSDTMRAYRGQAMGDLDPHVFAVAEEAYTQLEREQRHQSVVVSGESGAGKTVSAKYAMRYFATVSGSGTSDTETHIEKKVLASSPIMEAIGNAKTTRNDNSSRFGKYIEIHFNKHYHMVGASMRTYLLEKSRVVFQAPEERNYHIFYQLCAAREKLPQLNLDHQNNFNYLNQGDNPDIDGVDDQQTFEETMNALSVLGFSKSEQLDSLKILAAILHLGNVRFRDIDMSGDHSKEDSEGCGISENDLYLKNFCDLLQIKPDEMRQWLCTRRIVSTREVFLKPMTIKQAIVSRDALAKHVYAELFNWIVHVINKTLESSNIGHKFIGVLDIYGFETFEINSFEQFCINYANEKLQQQFNQHVFKLEQEEYIKEEIEWKMIDFYDNQPCIDLIESKLGILDLLDEECRMPKGSDASWVEKLYSKCIKYEHFVKPRFGNSAFLIKHFADTVEYESLNFLEKNRDTVIEEQINVLRKSENKLMRKLFTADDDRKLSVPNTRVKISASKQPQVPSQKANKKTVGSQFRDSLNMLMGTLNDTTPHYVRCIKPNDNKVCFEYNPTRAVQQLRACGVLETVRISAAGFPSRWFYTDFFYRYRVLCRFKDIKRNDMRATCEKILSINIKDADKYQFGKSKIFFRAGQVAYLEKLRAEKLKKCCIIVQSQIRAFIFRKRYLKLRKSVMLIQRYGRGLLGRRLATHLRANRAAITIQRFVRGWVKRTQFQRTRQVVLGLQRYGRGVLARRRFLEMKYRAKAIIIQRWIRGWLARKRYEKHLKSIIICQSAVRRWLARKQFKKLRIEARSVEHIKKLNKGLENKIISLQQRIEELNKDSVALKTTQKELNEMKLKLENMKGLEAEVKKLMNLLKAKDKELIELEDKLRAEKDEKIDLIQEQESFETKIKNERLHWTQENEKLRKDIENLNATIKNNMLGVEETIKLRVQQEKLVMLSEQDQEKNAHQQLLREYNTLEQHCDSLEQRLSRYERSGFNLPSSATSTLNRAHIRSSSDVSSTVGDGPIEITDDDYGYGSVRSHSSGTTASVQTIDWKRAETSSPEPIKATDQQIDLNLVVKLQQKVKDVEAENSRLQLRLERYERDTTPSDEDVEESRSLNAIRATELEVDNSRLQKELDQLRAQVTDKVVMEQFATLQAELNRRREEIIELRRILANQTSNVKAFTASKYGSDVDIVNEDQELILAFEAQKKINQQLEIEFQNEQTRNKELEDENVKLRDEIEKYQTLSASTLNKSPESKTEAYLHHEVVRLTSENLDLTNKYDCLAEKYRTLRKEARHYAKLVKEAGLDKSALIIRNNEQKVHQIEETIIPDKVVAKLPSIKKKEREFQGMFEYKKDEEPTIMRHLINDLKPRVAVQLLPGLPAYIIFMCIRHTDSINDDEKVKALLSSYFATVKKTVKKRNDDLETIVLWLLNTLRLLDNLKQYSGDVAFQLANTPKQNEQCLKNFDLSEFRQVLSDIGVWIYHESIRNMQEKIQALIVPAILEHEAISNIGGNKLSVRNRSASVGRDLNETPIMKAPQALVAELNNFHKILCCYGMSPEIIEQVFRQLFFFICATSLNNLLLRKEFCHWSKGCQIRYNLSNLEMWAREKHLDSKIVMETLEPIIQAAHLLQARKTDEDVTSICEMCSKLTAGQICKILQLYTPLDDYEVRVPTSFIMQVQAKLKENARDSDANEQEGKLLLDTKYDYPIRFSFNPSPICLEDIEIPEVLNLPQLKKI